MGYAMMFANCAACRMPFGFNPIAVPALVINGRKEPICRNCANRWNELHPENARAIRSDAYEAVDENELL